MSQAVSLRYNRLSESGLDESFYGAARNARHPRYAALQQAHNQRLKPNGDPGRAMTEVLDQERTAASGDSISSMHDLLDEFVSNSKLSPPISTKILDFLSDCLADMYFIDFHGRSGKGPGQSGTSYKRQTAEQIQTAMQRTLGFLGSPNTQLPEHDTEFQIVKNRFACLIKEIRQDPMFQSYRTSLNAGNAGPVKSDLSKDI